MAADNDNAAALAPELSQRLRAAVAAKAGSYEQRTRHNDQQGQPLYVNRLILEDSPYLLQHAHNPVDWYPWGSEAFAQAESADKPIFLSIGYSTCHWCHVMEEESFDNLEIARRLNQYFISIKLDREQFPDIDEIYMTAVQVFSGQGGWPMSNFLLPDGKPFFGATYFPPQQFMALLQRIDSLWQEKRSELVESAEQVNQVIAQHLEGKREAGGLDLDGMKHRADEVLEREDRHFGGLEGAPKFPQEPLLLYALHFAARERNLDKMAFASRALDAMARGGIYDQVGGGFHRYATDIHWLVPHFEKMLYNQSQLVMAYLHAWQLTKNRYFQRIVQQTLAYVLREMQLPEGGFYSATDADSDGEEGLFFIWSEKELQSALGKEDFDFVSSVFQVSSEGNFEGANILSIPQAMDNILAGREWGEFTAQLDGVTEKLRLQREQRNPPLRDDKMIVAWSAAMATVFIRSAALLQEKDYLLAAEKAVQFMWDQAYKDHRLNRIYLDGSASVPAQLEDYAWFITALIELYDVTSRQEYLDRSDELCRQALSLFWNDESGRFFQAQPAHDTPQLVRSSNAGDNATVSASAVMLDALLALDKRSRRLQRKDRDYGEIFRQGISALSSDVNAYPSAHVSVLRVADSGQQGSISTCQYAGNGLLQVTAHRSHDTIQFACDLLEGYHIDLGTDNLGWVLTPDAEDSDWEIQRVDYQGATANTPGSSAHSLQEQFTVIVELSYLGQTADMLSKSTGLLLSVQLCTNELCLAPETLKFRL